MKKIFLVFGVAAFSSASAQQNDLFDIQKHLQKKIGEDKKAAENKSLLLPFYKPFNFVDPYLTSAPGLSYILPNGDKVIISSPGSMPCIQPDMSQFRSMPNLADGEQFNHNYFHQKPFPGQIPNGSRPYRMIASK